MRADLREKCDDIWVIDCSPEGHTPPVATRIFQGVMQEVCIVLASRSPETTAATPATVRFRRLAKGHRDEKFAELADVTLASGSWQVCPSDGRAPFLPRHEAGWGDYIPLDALVGDCGSGVMPGRTWVIAPDAGSLSARWQRLLGEVDAEERAALFHPHLRSDAPGDRHIDKGASQLGQGSGQVASIEFGLANSDSSDADVRGQAKLAVTLAKPIRYGFRSLDRQWIIPDKRIINSPSPTLWAAYGDRQLYLTALTRTSPTNGPAISFTSLTPDLDHYHGRGGRVFSLWRDAAATQPNVPAPVLAALEQSVGRAVSGPELMAYLAAIASHRNYTARFAPHLANRPGLRIPVTAEGPLFDEAVALGQRVIWLHTYGDRFADPDATPPRPAAPPRAATDSPTFPKGGAIPPDRFPDTLRYDAAKRRLHVGEGHIDHVSPAVWAYEVSGKRVVTQWFSYRKLDRSRPIIGDRRAPSPLGDIQPDQWLPEYTSEMINLLNVLTLLVELEPAQADLLQRICDGTLVSAAELGGGA